MSRKQSSHNHISAPLPKQWRPRSAHWPHRHPSERSAHWRIRSQRAHFNWVLNHSFHCFEIFMDQNSKHTLNAFMGVIGHEQKCSVSKASDQAGLCTFCCSRRNSPPSTHLWGCWPTHLLAGRCLQPTEQGLKWGEELFHQQLSQQMWASTPRPQGRPEKWSLLLHCWVCIHLFILKSPQLAHSYLRLPFQNPKVCWRELKI